MALADVYDALISRRAYKAALSHEEAVAQITADRGTRFDPEVVDGFLEIEAEFKRIGLKHADPDRAQAEPNQLRKAVEPR
jgi:putative two-component system response regulator